MNFNNKGIQHRIVLTNSAVQRCLCLQRRVGLCLAHHSSVFGSQWLMFLQIIDLSACKKIGTPSCGCVEPHSHIKLVTKLGCMVCLNVLFSELKLTNPAEVLRIKKETKICKENSLLMQVCATLV